MTAKIPRGFAIMAPDRQRAIASAGGKAAHAQHVAHEWTASEAAVAGRVGGRVSQAARRARAAAVDPRLREQSRKLHSHFAAALRAQKAQRRARADQAAPGREEETR